MDNVAGYIGDATFYRRAAVSSNVFFKIKIRMLICSFLFCFRPVHMADVNNYIERDDG